MKLIDEQSHFNENKKLVRILTQQFNNETDSNNKEKIEFEILYLSTEIRNAVITFRNEELKKKLNSEASINYLKQRIEKSSNEKLKLFYYYLIWNSTEKHNKYLVHINELTSLIVSDPNFDKTDFDNYLIIENHTALFYDKEEFKEQTKININKYLSTEQTEAAMYKLCLLEFLYDLKKFKLTSIEQIENYMIDVFDFFIKKHHVLIAERILEIALKISNKLNLDQLIWHDKTAKIYENHADVRISDPQPMISYKYYIKAKEHFQKSKNLTKVLEIEKKISETQKRPILSRVPGLGLPQEIAIAKYRQSISYAENILNLKPDLLFDQLFKLKNQLIEIPEEEKTPDQHSFELFSNTEFDINRNVFDRSLSKNLEFNTISLLVYSQNLEISIVPILDRILIDGYLSGKLNQSEFWKQIEKRTWLTQKQTYYTSSGSKIDYTWGETIKPSINLLFEVLEDASYRKKNFEEKVILIVDSLSSKFEGLMREILRIKGIPTTKKVRNESQEMTLEDLISSTCIKNTFSPREVLFIKYVLTRQGLNIRNNISHAYFKSKRFYHWNQILYLIFLIIIVGDKEIIDGT
jgi:hypothetical protein